MAHISVVIPVYRAENVLAELHTKLVKALESVTLDFEILFVEDCGGDRSWLVIQQLAEKDKRVHGIKLSRNFGQHAATICGFKSANGEWVITLDDDLEQDPADIPKLFHKAQQGYSLVYGVYPQRTHSAWRNFTSELARRLFNIAIPSLNSQYTSFRVIHRTLAKAICTFDSPFPFVDGYLSWVTNNYSTVKVSHGTRHEGNSNYTFRKLFAHTVNIFVTFSDLPLKIATWTGLCSFLLGIFWGIGIVLAKMLGGITVSGFASLMAGTVLFGGIQLFILGIFGEYLGRMNFKSSKKPLFLISETISNDLIKNKRDAEVDNG